MKIEFLACRVTLVMYSVIIGFMHIWCKDAKSAAYSKSNYSKVPILAQFHIIR